MGKRASPAEELPADQSEATQEVDEVPEEEYDSDAPPGSDAEIEVSLHPDDEEAFSTEEIDPSPDQSQSPPVRSSVQQGQKSNPLLPQQNLQRVKSPLRHPIERL